MILNLFARKKTARIPEMYAVIVAQARQPVFYVDFKVPDTIDGRFDLLVLHLILVLHRLKNEDVSAREDGRRLSEHFFKDMDMTMREMGVGDLSVPKRIKKMANAYFGRLNAYNDALDAEEDGSDPLAEALDRNIYPEGDGGGVAGHLADYVRVSVAELAKTDLKSVLAGKLTFPDPAGFAPKGEQG